MLELFSHVLVGGHKSRCPFSSSSSTVVWNWQCTSSMPADLRRIATGIVTSANLCLYIFGTVRTFLTGMFVAAVTSFIYTMFQPFIWFADTTQHIRDIMPMCRWLADWMKHDQIFHGKMLDDQRLPRFWLALPAHNQRTVSQCTQHVGHTTICTKSPQSQFHWENGSYQQSVGDFPRQKRLELKDSSWKMLKTIRIAAIPTASIGIPNLRRALDASSLKVIGLDLELQRVLFCFECQDLSSFQKTLVVDD